MKKCCFDQFGGGICPRCLSDLKLEGIKACAGKGHPQTSRDKDGNTCCYCVEKTGRKFE